MLVGTTHVHDSCVGDLGKRTRHKNDSHCILLFTFALTITEADANYTLGLTAPSLHLTSLTRLMILGLYHLLPHYSASAQIMQQSMYTKWPHSGKPSWIRGFVVIRESFLHEIGRHGIFWWWHQRAICKSFLRENLIFHQFVSFIPQKFPIIRYQEPDIL